jgi:hypothetical protein
MTTHNENNIAQFTRNNYPAFHKTSLTVMILRYVARIIQFVRALMITCLVMFAFSPLVLQPAQASEKCKRKRLRSRETSNTIRTTDWLS